jgi:superfamily II RNA helicase
LGERLPGQTTASPEELLERFLDYVRERGLELYPAQEEALLELWEGKNVILNTPTGSGKSLVAAALHFLALAQGRRSVYTCPIKALVNEKWMALCRDFGPENVGLSTGDATVNRNAPLLCCTAEILANIALREGAEAPVEDAVLDEFHYYADPERGVAWQVPLLTLPQTRFLLMSATLGDTTFFEEALTRLNGRPTVTVRSDHRPVPLSFAYAETPLAQTVERLLGEGKAPIYVVHFTQAEAADNAQNFTSLNVCTREEKQALARALEGYRFTSPYGPEIKKYLRQGIGLHHAGLLPRYRVLVEQLAQQGLLKVICGTDTLGVGINVPIRTVLFTRLCKFDGQKTAILTARDFHQIAGRAGRKGFDDRGFVVAQAPEHVVENLKLEEKARRDGKKYVKRRPPEHNFVNWDAQTFRRLIAAPPEKLVSRFQVTHSMLLQVLSRRGDGCRAMQRLVRDCHEPPKAKAQHRRRAWQLFRALVERGIIEFTPQSEDGAYLRVRVDFQEDFSMDQTLSLYLLETLPLLDPQAPDYALNAISLVESILEDPVPILRRQLDRLKAQRLAEMKQQGLDYEERMAELEQLEHPKPLRDFIYSTFNAFADKHPWVGQENIRPKSIAREMFEQFRSFADYVKDYELQRVEGLLLRHLHSVYKVLAQTVPDQAKNETLWEMEVYLRTLLRQVDSSLLEEWEKMLHPETAASGAKPPAPPDLAPPGSESGPADITRDRDAFLRQIRTLIFNFLRNWQCGEPETAIEQLFHREDAAGQPWTPERLEAAYEAYLREHERLCLDPEARNRRHTYLDTAPAPRAWRVQQMLVDPQGLNDWVAEFTVDLPASRRAEAPALRLERIGPLVGGPPAAGNA